MSSASRTVNRRFRHKRVRRKVSGTAERPRVAVHVSLKQISIQFIDDENGVTLASASSHGMTGGNNVVRAKELGDLAAGKAKEQGITQAVFDRSGFAYHGRVKVIAEAIREGGVVI